MTKGAYILIRSWGLKPLKAIIFGLTIALFCIFWGNAMPVLAAGELEEVLDRVEKRYAGSGFAVQFNQESTIKAMDITDQASGKLEAKRPGKMRWEYIQPEPQTIISDGESLWVYRPQDNQVMIGKAPQFFGEGKGAGFLSDIRLVRKEFIVSLEKSDQPDRHLLMLIPKKKSVELSEIYLYISKGSAVVEQIVTFNAYGDRTVITMHDYRFDLKFSEGHFSFTIPQGADVMHLDE
jgi:outer membrane lipoprotein carrier protein